MSVNKQPLFMIVDGHALIYRAYHAFPGLTDPQGRLVNAVYGFTRILLTALNDIKPNYVAVAFDHKGATKRASELFKDYKAHRPEMPEDLKPQIELVKKVVDALNIPRFEQEGYEADDLIGTVTRLIQEDVTVLNGIEAPLGVKSLIVTGDKDLFQLINDQVSVWLPARGKGKVDEEIKEEGVMRILGVLPMQVPDLKGLMGDASDNIPGVKGVGPKTAMILIKRYGSVEEVYEEAEKIKNASPAEQKMAGFSAKLLERLLNDKQMALLSKELATINRHLEVEFSLKACTVTDYDKEKTLAVFEELDFKSLQYLLPKDAFEIGVQKALF